MSNARLRAHRQNSILSLFSSRHFSVSFPPKAFLEEIRDMLLVALWFSGDFLGPYRSLRIILILKTILFCSF